MFCFLIILFLQFSVLASLGARSSYFVGGKQHASTAALTGQFLWLTDIHFDPLYNGSSILANNFCRTNFTFPTEIDENERQDPSVAMIRNRKRFANSAFEEKRMQHNLMHKSNNIELAASFDAGSKINYSYADFGRYGCDAPINLVRTS